MATKAEIQNSLLAATDGCLLMQADHLANLQSGRLAKVGQWLEERQVMVAKLRQAFTEAQGTGLDADLRQLLAERIKRLLEGESRLFAVAEQQRNAVGDALGALRRGKRALSGYGPGPNQGPTFVSDRG